MGYSPSRLGKVQLQNQGAWGTKAAFGGSGELQVECEVWIPTPTQELLQPNTMTGSFYAQKAQAGSKAGSTFSLTMPLHGFSSSTPSGNPTMHAEAMMIYGALGGGNSLAGYAASGAMSPTASNTYGDYIILDDGSFAETALGRAVLVATGTTNSVGWVREVNNQTNYFYFWDRLGSAVTADTTIYGSSMLYLTTTQPTPLTVRWQGFDQNHALDFYDCVVTSVTLNIVPGQQPTMTCEFLAGMWEVVDHGSSLSDYDLSSLPQLPSTSAESGGKFRVQNVAWDSTDDVFQSRSMSSVDITMSAEYTPSLSHSSPNGVGQYICTNRTVTMQYNELGDGTQGLGTELGTPGSTSTRSAGDGCHILTVNTTPGQALSIMMPVAKQKELSELSDSEGVISVSRTIEPGFVGLQGVTTGLETAKDGGGSATAATGGVENTPFRIAFL